MSLFSPRSSGYEPNFSGLFRLIDDFDKYSTGPIGINTSNLHHRETAPFFTPKFDLQETANAYILHGELPGIEKKNVNIEFTDDQTLTIRGRTERSYSHESKDENELMTDNAANDSKDGEKELIKTNNENKQIDMQNEKLKAKYWVSERSFGEFSRSFNFPTNVDSGAAVAKLDNGILNLIVPKAKKLEGRRVDIQ